MATTKNRQEAITKYIELAFSPISPLIKEFQDNIKGRRKKACYMAGIPEDEISDIINGKNQNVNQAVLSYVVEAKNNLWCEIVCNEFLYLEWLSLCLKDLDSPDDSPESLKQKYDISLQKAKLSDELIKMRKKLETSIKEFVAGDGDVIDVKRITPESF